MYSQTYNKGDDVTLPLQASCLAPSGKVFAGWLQSPNGTATTSTYRCNADKTFYAKWNSQVEYYKITLNDNCHVSGGSPTGASEIYYAILNGGNNLTPGKWYVNMPVVGFVEINQVTVPTCGTATYNGHKINNNEFVILSNGNINTDVTPTNNATAVADWGEEGSPDEGAKTFNTLEVDAIGGETAGGNGF